MQKTVYQTPELRDSNDNIIQQGAFGKNTALSNATNDGWIDYVMNDLEALHDVVGESSPTLDANGHVVEPANLAIGDEDGNRIKNSYLKLSGGKVTGIASFRTDLRMLDNQDNRWGGLYVPGTTSSVQYLSLYGGTRTTGDARLNLYNTGNGKFELTGYSTNGANAYTLTNDNNGNLNWRGYPLAWKKDYLPLTGGTLTGTTRIVSEYRLAFNGTQNNPANSYLYSNPTNGFYLETKNDNNNLLGRLVFRYTTGNFEIDARNASGTAKTLLGTPDGTLTWGGNNIALSKDVLQLSGGTMSGIVTHSNDTAIKRSTDSNAIVICGASADNKGANLTLFGKDYTNANSRNSFSLTAHDGTTGKALKGKADGTLTWGGNNILTSAIGCRCIKGSADGAGIFKLNVTGSSDPFAAVVSFGGYNGRGFNRVFVCNGYGPGSSARTSYWRVPFPADTNDGAYAVAVASDKNEITFTKTETTSRVYYTVLVLHEIIYGDVQFTFTQGT